MDIATINLWFSVLRLPLWLTVYAMLNKLDIVEWTVIFSVGMIA